MNTIMKYLPWFIPLCGVFIGAFFLEAPPVARTIDPEIGMSIPLPGSSSWRFTEGGSITRFKEHGLNAALPDGIANVYLHGDSYIEALMVPDEKKPDAVLTRELGGINLVWGIGRSGTGIPSFIVHAREYERLFGMPKVHVFFVTSSDDITGDNGDEYIWNESGIHKCPPKTSRMQMSFVRMVNKYHLNFLISCYNNFNRLKHKRWHFYPSASSIVETNLPSPCLSTSELLDMLCDEIRRTIKAPVLFVYCPDTPVITNGCIIFQEGEECFLKLKGMDVLNVAPALNDLYKIKGILPRGYANASGPGIGHLNVYGIEVVFSYVAKYLKDKYAL